MTKAEQKQSNSKADVEVVTIRKYANRRLYNTQISSYVTLDDLCEMIQKGEEFQVVDAKSGEDLTKSVLTQIIFEQEAKGANMLPAEFLKSVIRFYDDSLKNVVPAYLQSSMDNFVENQEDMRDKVERAMANSAAFAPMNQMADIYSNAFKNQQEMFAKTFDMFTSFNPMMNKNKED